MAERAHIQALMVRLAEGDRSAFDPLFDLTWPLVQRFAARALPGDPAAADDAAQATLLKIFERASSFDPAREALPWIFTLAAYEVRTVRKQRARRREVGPPEDHATVVSPEHDLERRSLAGAAAQVLSELSPADLQTLELWAYDAERPAVAPATFRKRVERALDRFRRAWRDRHGHR